MDNGFPFVRDCLKSQMGTGSRNRGINFYAAKVLDAVPIWLIMRERTKANLDFVLKVWYDCGTRQRAKEKVLDF